MTAAWQELFRLYGSWSLRSSVRPHGADHMSRGPSWLSADLVPIIVDGFEVRAQVRGVLILGLSTGCHYVVFAPTNSCDRCAQIYIACLFIAKPLLGYAERS